MHVKQLTNNIGKDDNVNDYTTLRVLGKGEEVRPTRVYFRVRGDI